jgi:hypothetical protein
MRMRTPSTPLVLLGLVAAGGGRQDAVKAVGQTESIAPGQVASSLISSRDRPCGGRPASCRVFVVMVEQSGTLRASLSWPDPQIRLRLDLWNGITGNGTCCAPGESVAISATPKDHLEIDVRLDANHGQSDRHPFELRTAFESTPPPRTSATARAAFRR